MEGAAAAAAAEVGWLVWVRALAVWLGFAGASLSSSSSEEEEEEEESSSSEEVGRSPGAVALAFCLAMAASLRAFAAARRCSRVSWGLLPGSSGEDPSEEDSSELSSPGPSSFGGS